MGITVLIVDDRKLVRNGAGKTIAALQPGWTRVGASNADEAPAALDRHPVDVALLDVNMPGRDGLALAPGAAFVPKPVTEDGLRGFLPGAALRFRAAEA